MSDQQDTNKAAVPAAETPKIESPKLAPAQDAATAPLKSESVATPAAAAEAPHGLAHTIRRAALASHAAITAAVNWLPALQVPSFAQTLRFSAPRVVLSKLHVTPLVAAVVLVGATGVMAGAIGTLGVERYLDSQSGGAQAAESRAVRDAITRLGADLASIRNGVDTSTRAVTKEVARLSERIDKLDRRAMAAAPNVAPQAAASAPQVVTTVPTIPTPRADVTGTITNPPLLPKEQSKPPVVPGWVVRNVYQGIALIQSREGMFEVEVGDPLPMVGTVEAIQRRDGRWVVVTTRGLIVSAQR